VTEEAELETLKTSQPQICFLAHQFSGRIHMEIENMGSDALKTMLVHPLETLFPGVSILIQD
jgi:hypothetical protein